MGGVPAGKPESVQPGGHYPLFLFWFLSLQGLTELSSGNLKTTPTTPYARLLFVCVCVTKNLVRVAQLVCKGPLGCSWELNVQLRPKIHSYTGYKRTCAVEQAVSCI